MSIPNIDVHILDVNDFLNPKIKNQYISIGNKEWVLFSVCDITLLDIEMIERAIEENDHGDIGLFVFLNNDSTSLEKPNHINLIINYDYEICAILFKRDLLILTGCFNELLGNGCNIEFINRFEEITCVRAMRMRISDSYDGFCRNRDFVNDTLNALAFICVKKQVYAQSDDFKKDFACLIDKLTIKGNIQYFRDKLNMYVSDLKLFERVVRQTAPIFIISGNDICYGVLRDFADKLAETFASLGQALITTDGRYAPYSGLEDIENRILKAIIGFQAPVLFEDYFRNFNADKYQFWFDDPVFFNNMFQKVDDSYWILCQDSYHAEHLKNHYSIDKALQFSPGGIDSGEPDYSNRDLDVVFIGTYREPEIPYLEDDLRSDYCQYMLDNPSLTYENGLKEVLGNKSIEMNEEEFMKLLWSMGDIFRYIRDVYRFKVIETIICSGIKINVYGDSWKKYQGPGQGNLIIHSELIPSDSLNILRRAKISMNIMTWHKGGMTERVINSMLCGAVCVSDTTSYLAKISFDSGICLYDLNHIEKVSGYIEEILADDDKRKNMSRKAYLYAKKNETWYNRACNILKTLEKDSNI